MRMKIDAGWLYIIEASPEQAVRIKAWNLMKFRKKDAMWYGRVSGELLERLSRIVPLPVTVEAERMRINKVQRCVDRMRTTPTELLKPLVKYPVKKNLYAHQIRAANMALLTFGIADPSEVENDD